MKPLCSDVTEMIGGTPLVEVPTQNRDWKLFLKMEKTNPGQSMKDRMALSMIEGAEQRGLLKPGATIVESSSGNTGIGLAMIAAARGYKFIAVVDHHAAPEKIAIIKAYGGKIVQVGSQRIAGKVAVREREEEAARLSREIPGAFFPNQADNPDNPEGYASLAREIHETINNVRVLIGGIGTGGSLCGTARELKRLAPSVEIMAVEPVGSIIFGGPAGEYLQSGTGNPGDVEIASNVDRTLIEKPLTVTDKEAFETARFLARKKGLLVGGSAGGVIYKALENIVKRKGRGVMVALIADGGEKYLSTIFNDEWMQSHNLFDASVETRLRIFLNLHEDGEA